MKLEKSVVLVTGANRGLGKALVERALTLGAAKVYAAARDAKAITIRDARVVPLQLDVTSSSDIQAVAAQATDLTMLVNNAGVASSTDVFGDDVAALERDLAVNFWGPVALIKALRPTLTRTAPSAVVNVLTVASLASFPILSGYSATKAAAHSMTQAARLALKGANVRVFAVYPGPIDTEMVRDLPVPKTSPADVAANIFAGVLEGREDIFPDAMSQQAGDIYGKSPKALERQFAGG